uniref:AAA+ ATPase domain-containing protein n=1 Tax=Oryza barthii TaxID=65489 RepID=A0A0D3HKE9_9ORYZ
MAGALVSASTGVMESLLGKLSSMLEKEYAKKKTVEKDVLFLRNELSSMNTVMRKYAMSSEPDLQVKAWMKEVRELAYNIEDIIDAFMAQREIEELKNQVLEVNDRRKRYKLDVSVSIAGCESLDPRLPAFYSEVGGLVGIDGPRDKIIKLLRKEAVDEDCGFVNQLKMVSITGFGGMGKTILAKQVYQKIKWQFDCAALVFVSQMPDMKRILLDLLSGLGASGNTWDDERQLIDKIREFLHDKRYLIVIDDIWSLSAWEILKCVLPENNSGSRIITTTRILDIAALCCSTFKGNIYRLEPLGDSDSRRLFCKRIFHGEHSCPSHLVELSKAILRKCGGLPLAILHIASLLATKSNTKEEWELVLNSIGSALENSHTLQEDWKISPKKLIRKWIAEGFIAEDRCNRLDQVAESYFNELINRSMILPVSIAYDGSIQICQVHDLVLNIIISISKEDNFVTVIDGQKCSSLPEKIHRLSLQFNDSEDAVIPANITNKNSVRSISVFGSTKQVPYFMNLQSLRVLDLGYCTLLQNHHIECLGSMLQLRYLVLHSQFITELPDEIGNLQHLEMLDVTLCSMQALPDTIVRLQKLVCLYVSTKAKLPERIGTMQSLEELFHISSNSIRFVEDLKCLTKLRDLAIAVEDPVGTESSTLRYREAVLSSVSELGRHDLQSLSLNYKGDENFILDSSMGSCFSTQRLRKLIIGKTLSRVPEWMSIFDNLIHLQLYISGMEKSDINILKGISTLLFLRLVFTGHAPHGRIVIDNRGFQALKELYLLFFVPGIWPVFEPGAMQELQKYHLTFKLLKVHCSSGVLDFGLQHLSSLQHMSAIIVPSGATSEDTFAAEDAIRSATSIHPNQPTAEIFIQ